MSNNKGTNSSRIIRKELAYWVQRYNELKKEGMDMSLLRIELRKYGVAFDLNGDVVHF